MYKNYSVERYSFICPRSNGFKYCFVLPIFQFKYPVKWLQVLLFNTNYSIQHLSFVQAQVNDSKYSYVFLTIQSHSHLFAHC